MKTYSDLPDTKLQLDVELELIGSPDFLLTIESGDRSISGQQDLKQSYEIDPLTPFAVIIQLMNKDYNIDNKTAIIINRISVDNILIIPKYTHFAEYNNDHGYINPTNYLGFNGKWTLTFDRPFYQWLHQATAQGMLLG